MSLYLCALFAEACQENVSLFINMNRKQGVFFFLKKTCAVNYKPIFVMLERKDFFL